MRAVVQRVRAASVSVDGEVIGRIGVGLCVFIGVHREDDDADGRALAKKIVSLRIFEDGENKMNLDVRAAGGAVLAVSQFTLYGDVRRGNRPSFGEAMEPGAASRLFDDVCRYIRDGGLEVQTGRFGARMDVHIENAGPVTILVDSRR